MENIKRSIEEPKIISLRPSLYEPYINAEDRKKREKKIHYQISHYLKKVGFSPSSSGKYTTASLNDKKLGKIDVVFQYYENSEYIKKNFEVYCNGKRSNIQTLRKLYLGNKVLCNKNLLNYSDI